MVAASDHQHVQTRYTVGSDDLDTGAEQAQH